MEDQSKNPFINQDTGKQTVGPFDYGHNPPIHKLKSGNKYPNNILDLPDSSKLKRQYFNEPETKTYFKNNPKIKMQFYMEKEPRTYTNPYKGVSAINAPKGVFPKG